MFSQDVTYERVVCLEVMCIVIATVDLIDIYIAVLFPAYAKIHRVFI